MFKRVDFGPDDNPDEYWFECPDCEGSGKVSVPDEEHWDEGVEVSATCPVCEGLGRIEGDADDVED